ncbi:MAG: ABC transporter substrate-binding protein [Sphaerobacter sp.]|nr:ABC transporter substrate-binding protein [Sphaerobacter sp.]
MHAICRILALVSLLLLPLVAASCGTERAAEGGKVTVALDWYPNANHAGLYLAKERGYFRQAGLDVTLYTPANPDDVLQLVGTGKDTFGISYEADVLLARAQGIPVRAIAAIVQHPLNSLMALQSSGITRPKDLEGKKVGGTGLPGEEAMLATMLAADGSSLDRVQMVNVGYDLLPALLSGRVDAIAGGYWTHEAILAEQQGHPVTVLRVEDWGVPDYYELVLVTSEETIANRPELVQRFVDAVVHGYEDAVADHAAALDAIQANYAEMDRATEERGIERLAPLFVDASRGFGWQAAEKWSHFAGWMEERGLLTTPVDADAAFTNQFLERAGGR